MKKLNPLDEAVSFARSVVIAWVLISIILACNSIILITYQFVHHDVAIVSTLQGLFILLVGVIVYFYTKLKFTKTDL